jgi:hypothetical protein
MGDVSRTNLQMALSHQPSKAHFIRVPCLSKSLKRISGQPFSKGCLPFGISTCPNDRIEYETVMVDSAPQPVLLAVDADVERVKKSDVVRARLLAASAAVGRVYFAFSLGRFRSVIFDDWDESRTVTPEGPLMGWIGRAYWRSLHGRGNPARGSEHAQSFASTRCCS